MMSDCHALKIFYVAAVALGPVARSDPRIDMPQCLQFLAYTKALNLLPTVMNLRQPLLLNPLPSSSASFSCYQRFYGANTLYLLPGIGSKRWLSLRAMCMGSMLCSARIP